MGELRVLSCLFFTKIVIGLHVQLEPFKLNSDLVIQAAKVDMVVVFQFTYQWISHLKMYEQWH